MAKSTFIEFPFLYMTSPMACHGFIGVGVTDRARRGSAISYKASTAATARWADAAYSCATMAVSLRAFDQRHNPLKRGRGEEYPSDRETGPAIATDNGIA